MQTLTYRIVKFGGVRDVSSSPSSIADPLALLYVEGDDEKRKTTIEKVNEAHPHLVLSGPNGWELHTEEEIQAVQAEMVRLGIAEIR